MTTFLVPKEELQADAVVQFRSYADELDRPKPVTPSYDLGNEGASTFLSPSMAAGTTAFPQAPESAVASPSLPPPPPASSPFAAPPQPTPPPAAAQSQDWQSLAFDQLNKPYIWGSQSGAGGRGAADIDPATGLPRGFDCSGYVSWVMKNGLGIDLPAFTGSAYAKTTNVGIKDAQPGDVVFYNMDNPDPRVQHMAIYLGDGKIIQAGGTGGNVNIASLYAGGTPEIRRAAGEGSAGVSRAATYAASQVDASHPVDAFKAFADFLDGAGSAVGTVADATGTTVMGAAHGVSDTAGSALDQFRAFADDLTAPKPMSTAPIQNDVPSYVREYAQQHGSQVADNPYEGQQPTPRDTMTPGELNQRAYNFEGQFARDLGGMLPGGQLTVPQDVPIIGGVKAGDVIGEAIRPTNIVTGEVGGRLAGMALKGAAGSEPIMAAGQAIREGAGEAVDALGGTLSRFPVRERGEASADFASGKLSGLLGRLFPEDAVNPEAKLQDIYGRARAEWESLRTQPPTAETAARMDDLNQILRELGQADAYKVRTVGDMATAPPSPTRTPPLPPEPPAGAASGMAGGFADDPAYKAVDSMYSSPPVLDQGKAVMGEMGTNIVRWVTDRSIDLKRFQQAAEKNAGRALNADEMAYELTRLDPGGSAMIRVQEGLRPAIQSAGRENYDLLRQYITHTGNLDVATAKANPSRAFSGGLTAEDSARVLDSMKAQLPVEQFQKIEGAAQQIWDYGKVLLQRKLDAGLIDQGLYDHLTKTYPRYVPTKILDYLDDVDRIGVKKRISVSDPGIRRLSEEGTTKAREDPIASLVRATYETERLARKNEAAQAFLKLRDYHPDGALIRELTGDAATAKAPRDFEKVTAFIDGEKHVYQMPKHLADAVNLESQALIPGLSTLMNVVRMGMTARNPAFLASNALNDAITFTLRSSIREGGPQNAPKVLLELARGYADAFAGFGSGELKGAGTRQFLREGGGQMGFFSGSQADAARAASDLQRSGGLAIHNVGDLQKMIRDIATLRFVENAGQRIELAPRVAAMRLAEKRGANVVTSVMDGRTVTMDFARGGIVSKWLNQGIPFFNVGVQAGSQVWQAARENPKAFAGTVGALLVAPTVTAEVWNRSDEQRERDYEDVPQYLKDTGVVFMLPTAATDESGERKPQYLFLPTREYSPFVTAAREAIGRALGDDPREFRKLAFGMLGSVSPLTEGTDVLPVGASTVAQLATNTDFFRDRAITSRYTESEATDTAHAIANALQEAGRAGGQGEGFKVSGAATEFALRDTGGGVAGMLLNAGDMIGDLLGGRGIDRRDDRPQSLPVIGTLIGRFLKDQGGQVGRDARENRLTDANMRLLRDSGLGDYSIGPVSDSVKGIPLRPSEMTAAQLAVNEAVNTLIPELASSNAWQRITPDQRKKVIDRLVQEARDFAAKEATASVVGKGSADLNRRLEAEARQAERSKR